MSWFSFTTTQVKAVCLTLVIMLQWCTRLFSLCLKYKCHEAKDTEERSLLLGSSMCVYEECVRRTQGIDQWVCTDTYESPDKPCRQKRTVHWKQFNCYWKTKETLKAFDWRTGPPTRTHTCWWTSPFLLRSSQNSHTSPTVVFVHLWSYSDEQCTTDGLV